MAEPLTGKLLVASPGLADPNFDRTVVLVLEHNDDGALGVVLNRVTEGEIAELLPDWEEHAAAPPLVFQGGPVDTSSVICVAQPIEDDADDVAAEPDEGVQDLFGGLATIDLSRPPSDFPGRAFRIRVFAGYAGWGAGQLESEIDAGGWFVFDSRPGDAFTADPDGLWRRVFARQKGELAMVALYPDDPSMN